jgi:hypothetical protein
LDQDEFADHISDITDNAIHHCSNTKTGISVGDFFVGSTDGKLYQNKHKFSMYWLNNHDADANEDRISVATHIIDRTANPKPRKGLYLTRVITSITESSSLQSDSEAKCYQYATTEVHPIKLFDSFQINAESSSPYRSLFFNKAFPYNEDTTSFKSTQKMNRKENEVKKASKYKTMTDLATHKTFAHHGSVDTQTEVRPYD